MGKAQKGEQERRRLGEGRKAQGRQEDGDLRPHPWLIVPHRMYAQPQNVPLHDPAAKAGAC